MLFLKTVVRLYLCIYGRPYFITLETLDFEDGVFLGNGFCMFWQKFGLVMKVFTFFQDPCHVTSFGVGLPLLD